MKEALLILDMLNDFLRPGAPLEVPEARKILPVVRREIDKAHAAGFPVIFICDAHAPDDKEFRKFGWSAHAVKGSKGAEVVDELKPADIDILIHKTTYAGFFGTNLDETLRRLDVDSLRLTGVVTHICVLFTAYEAVLRNYAVTVVEDGVADIAKKDHIAALRIMQQVLGVNLIRSGREAGGRDMKAA